jgi:small subunit ribosomal protein S9
MAQQSEEQIQAVGRRKNSTARIILRPGSGQWSINGRTIQDFFPRLLHRKRAEEALKVTELDGKFDVVARARGGGVTGQADAIRLALARAVLEHDEETRPVLRKFGLLTRDPRKVERKKPGQPKARKQFQFSKR